MPANHQPRQQNEPANDDRMDGQDAARPDEDGPHDVPDEAVIEKTLPTIRPGTSVDRPA